MAVDVGHLSPKSDVYSFGVVLLEMLSGRRAVDKNRPSGQQNLVEWAKPYLANKRKLNRVLDNRLEGQYSMEDAHEAATLALRCLSTESKFRPSMDQVLIALEHLQVPINNGNGKRSTQNDGVNTRPRHHRISEDNAIAKHGNGRTTTPPYPRPSSSPLYA